MSIFEKNGFVGQAFGNTALLFKSDEAKIWNPLACGVRQAAVYLNADASVLYLKKRQDDPFLDCDWSPKSILVQPS